MFPPQPPLPLPFKFVTTHATAAISGPDMQCFLYLAEEQERIVIVIVIVINQVYINVLTKNKKKQVYINNLLTVIFTLFFSINVSILTYA